MLTATAKSCFSRRGAPRSTYPDRVAAELGAELVLSKYKSHMVPYRCTDCGLWHLCPMSRYTPSEHCDFCSKQAYESEITAERRAELLELERGVWLRVYACPHRNGWHLTSRRRA